MLRVIESANVASAKSYYSTADYYSEGQELVGRWRGRGAEMLGLRGEVRRKDWDALCENRHPETGKRLTQRQKANRRVGYDFNFHVPKSVSVVYGLTGDDRIAEAFRDSVRGTMEEIEAEMKTRVRSGKGPAANGDRTTGNMVWGEYVHTTARPVNGEPDPHLHAHCFVFNVTHDAAEGRWKAGQFADLKRDAPYFEAVFHATLSKRLADLGLPIERTKHGWEIAGVPQSSIERFSRRSAEIEQLARTKGVTDPKEKDGLGARTRQKKTKGMSTNELRQAWLKAISPEDRAAIWSISERMVDRPKQPDEAVGREAAHTTVRHAVAHVFERKSVVAERDLLRDAMRRGYGAATPDAVRDIAARQPLISAERNGRRMLTSREVLAEETAMLDIARRGRGACSPLGNSVTPVRDWLGEDQRRAVRHVLLSPDRVILVRGAAGTGKTTMMREAVEGIERGGRQVHVFAPSAEASRGVLRAEGFEHANTVAALLESPKLRESLRGQVAWIDEAGLLGTKTMRSLFELAEKSDARLILSGDRRQHGSVERGAALRLLETEAGLVPAEIREIRRQSGEYKRVVRLLSEGRVEDGYKGLARMGWIREAPDAEREQIMARDYVHALRELPKGERVLAISPTHREAESITSEIRRRLLASGELHGQARPMQVLRDARLTVAERSDPVNIRLGDVLVFHQNARGYRKGQRVAVHAGGAEPGVLAQAERFGVFRPGTLDVAAGDVLRVTRNGKTADGGQPLSNGELHRVTGFTHSGDLETESGKVIGRDYGHFDYGYVVTSHASQGKSVSHVLIGQSSRSFAASSQEQFYVSVSRGKKRATVYTDDKPGLLAAVSKSDPRFSATELVRERVQSLRRQEPVAPTRRRDTQELDRV